MRILKPINTIQLRAVLISMLLFLANSNMHAQSFVAYPSLQNISDMRNPAIYSSNKAIGATLLHRSRWVGIEGAPVLQWLNIYMPIQKHNITLAASCERLAWLFYERYKIHATFAYSLKISTRSALMFGLQGGIHTISIDGTKIKGDFDPIYAQFRNVIAPSAGFGLQYKYNQMFVGYVLPEILQSKDMLSISTAKIRLINNQHIFYAGTSTNVKNILTLRPIVFVNTNGYTFSSADVSLQCMWFKMFGTGIGVDTKRVASLYFDVQVIPNLRISYHYQMGLSTKQTFNNNSHEVVLSFEGKKSH